MTFKDLLRDLGEIAPFHLAQPWDRVGAMTGRESQPVQKVLVSLDPSPDALHKAIELGCQAWVTHHPLIWDPIKSMTLIHEGSPAGKPLLQTLVGCLENGIAAASCHTNWDAAEGGVNDALASALGLNVVERFGDGVQEERLKMAVTVPVGSRDSVIEAASLAGAGEIGRYQSCSFSWQGTGSFLPLPGAVPTEGAVGEMSRLEEIRVEMELPARLRGAVESAVRDAHPYEEPAIDWLVCQSRIIGRLGVIAECGEPTTLESFAAAVCQKLRTSVRVYGPVSLPIKRAALVGGAGSGFWRQAAERSQALITGEVRQNDALEAAAAGFCLIEAGHYATEQPGMEAMTSALRARGWEAALFVPLPGRSGRPFDPVIVHP